MVMEWYWYEYGIGTRYGAQRGLAQQLLQLCSTQHLGSCRLAVLVELVPTSAILDSLGPCSFDRLWLKQTEREV